MKIIFLSKYFYPNIGGVEKHVFEVSKELIKQKHKIIVITLRNNQKLKREQIYKGIRIVRLSNSNSKYVIWKNMWKAREILKKADIIHCHDVFFWYLFLRLLWPLKKVYTTFHGWEEVYPIPIKNILMHKLAEKLCNGSICVGDYLKKWYGHKPEFVTYGGVTDLCYDRSINPFIKKPSEVIFIGRLERVNAIEEYLKSLKIIKEKYSLKVTFVGDGKFKRKAEKIGKVTGLIKNICPYLKRNAYIFASSYLTIWEALNCGRLVLAIYNNPVKKDYLGMFSAVKAINIFSSGRELEEGLNKLKKTKVNIPSWGQVTKLYLDLWKKN